MSRLKIEWIINALLSLCILLLVGWMALSTVRSPNIESADSDLLTERAQKRVKSPGSGKSPRTETSYTARPALSPRYESPYPGLRTNIFAALITPTPRPTPRPPKAQRPPSLEQGTKGWTFQYPMRRYGKYVFLDLRKKEITISEDEPTPVREGRRTMDVYAKPGVTKYEVILYTQPEGHEVQEKTFSMLE